MNPNGTELRSEGREPLKMVPADSCPKRRGCGQRGKMGTHSSVGAHLFLLPGFPIPSLLLSPTFSSSLQTGTCLKADQSGVEAHSPILTWERQENQHSFEASVVYKAHSRPANDMQHNTVSKKVKQPLS